VHITTKPQLPDVENGQNDTSNVTWVKSLLHKCTSKQHPENLKGEASIWSQRLQTFSKNSQ